MKNKQQKRLPQEGLKNGSLKISANEINRFVYCPYQWYYSRYYGQTVLKEKYKALKDKNSKVESQFKKGLRFHQKYYITYRLQKILRKIRVILAIAVGIWVVMRLC